MSEQRISWNDQLRDPRWQRVRLEVMQAAGYKCVICGKADKTLNTHHAYYRKGLMAWEYPRESLLCICEDCHDETHSIREAINLAMATFTPAELRGVYSFMADYRAQATITRQQMREKYSRPLPEKRRGESDAAWLARLTVNARQDCTAKPLLQEVAL